MPVYQYEGKHYSLPDGLSPDEAKAKIEAHLGKGQAEESHVPQVLKDAYGGLEGVGTMIASAPGWIAGGLAGLGSLAVSGGDINKATETQNKVSDALSVHPRTDSGKQVQQMIGDVSSGVSNELGEGVEKFLQDPYLTKQYPVEGGVEVGFSPQNASAGRAIAQAGLGAAAALMPIKAAKAGERAVPKSTDISAIAKELDAVPPEPAPQLNTRKPGAQGELFPRETVTERIGKKNNTVEPGVASEFDPFQEQSPITPKRDRAQMNLPLDENLPPVIRQDRAGVGTLGTENPGLVAAVRRGTPEDVRVFDEMQQQLQAGQHTPIDTTLPRGDAIGDVAASLTGQRGVPPEANARAFLEAKQQEMFGPKMDLEGQPMDLPEKAGMRPMDGTQGELLGHPDLFELGKEEQPPRTYPPENVKEGPTRDLLDPNHPDFFDLKQEPFDLPKRPDNPLQSYSQEQEAGRYAAIQKAVQEDPRIMAANDRLAKAQELASKVEEAVKQGKTTEAHLKRVQADLENFRDALHWLTSNIEFEKLTEAKSENQIKSASPFDRSGPKPIGPGKKQGGYFLLEGKKQKALQNLADASGAEAKLRELKPSQWTVAQALEQAKKASDIAGGLVRDTVNLFTKGGQYMADKTHNPMIRYVVEKVLSADRKARAEVRDWVHARLAPAMRALKDKELADAWHVIELHDLKQKAIDYAMLKRNGMSDKQIHLIKEHAAGMDKAYIDLNKAREAAGKPPVDKRVAYAAMRASGDFRRLVYSDKEQKNVVGVLGSDYRTKVNSQKAAMEAKGLFVGEERYYGGMPRERGSATAAFQRAIESLAEKDPHVQDFVDVLNQIRTTEVYNFLNMKTHAMNKKGVFGMKGRDLNKSGIENAQDGFKAQLNYMEGAIKFGRLSEALKDAKQVLDSKEVKMPNAKEWSEKYMYNALGFNPEEMGRNIENAVASAFRDLGVGYSVGRSVMATSRKVVNGMLLMLNPRFWLTNVVQPFQAMPGMKAALIAKGLDAGFDFGTGYSYLGQAGATIMRRKMGISLDAFDKAAFKYAHDNHVYGSDLIEHSNKVRADIGYAAEKISNFGAQHVEAATRQLMFHAMTHLLKENGMKIENGLFETAHNLTDMSMNNYSAVERPRIFHKFGPLGDLAANLQSYKLNEMSRLAMFGRMAAKDAAMRPLAVQMLSALAFSGITGMVGFTAADQLYRLITKAMGKPDSLTNRVISLSERAGGAVNDATGGKVVAPYVASHGVFSMLGMDMSKSLGLNDIVPSSPADLLFPGSSKLGQAAGSAYDMATNPTELNAKRLARNVVPQGMQGAVDNKFFTKQKPQGLASVNPDNLRIQAYRNDTDKHLKDFGFTGIHESVQRQKTYNIEKESRDYSDLRQKPLSNMRDSLFQGKGQIDPKDIQKYVEYRGTVDSVVGDLQRYGKEQNMSARELAIMEAQMSSSVARLEKAKEYMRMFSDENKRTGFK